MEYEAYDAEAKIEEFHWWFVARRLLFRRELQAADIKQDAAILDTGTSTGTNLRMLRDGGYTNVTGLDASPVAVRFCAEKGLGHVQLGDVCSLPFADAHFDLVLATDIVEHVDDDAKAVAEVARVLKLGGTALFTVPCFPSLWGLQDDVSMHKRRYYKKDFARLVRAAGLEVRHDYYFNYLLFAPIWLARQLIRLLRVKAESENHMNTGLTNRLFLAIFTIDIRTASWLKPPFGVSALCLAVKPEIAER